MSAARLLGVSKIYRRSHLGRTTEAAGLSGLDLEIRRGEVFGLLGLNGAGKTTALKLLLGLHWPTSGTVELLGRPVPDPAVLARVGYAPEAAYLNPCLTARETVRFFARLSGLPPQGRDRRADETLARMGLSEAADRRLSRLSKGMLQRVSLAQALVHDPELVVLDEPATGLDPLAVREIRALILWLKGRGKTVLLASHDISEVERVCDRVAILSAGRLALSLERRDWEGRPDELERAFAASVRRADGSGPIRLDGEAPAP